MPIRNKDHCTASCPKTPRSFKTVLERLKPNRICRTETYRDWWENQIARTVEIMRLWCRFFAKACCFISGLPAACVCYWLLSFYIYMFDFFFLRPKEHLRTWYSLRLALPHLSNYKKTDKKHRAVLQLSRASQSTATSNSEQLGQDNSNNCHSRFHWSHELQDQRWAT